MSAIASAVRLARRPAAREATRETFDTLYRDNRDDVYAYVATLLRDRAAAEDVTASAFERAYRRHGQFDAGRGSPRSWIFGIARNAALDELRRRKRHAALPLEPADGDAAAAPALDAGEEDPARRATVHAAVVRSGTIRRSFLPSDRSPSRAATRDSRTRNSARRETNEAASRPNPTAREMSW